MPTGRYGAEPFKNGDGALATQRPGLRPDFEGGAHGSGFGGEQGYSDRGFGRGDTLQKP